VDVTVKIAVEVHRAAKLAAVACGMPLFAFVEEALREKLGRTKGTDMPAIFILFTSLLFATTAAAQTTYVWQLTCANDATQPYASFSLPEQCGAMRATIAETCERPLLAPKTPNPAFVRIAAVCKDAHNGWDCVCEYRAVEAARESLTVLEIVRAAEARGFLSVGDLLRARDAGLSIDAVEDLFHARRAATGGPIHVGP
jgi:hypothetical protein